MKCTRFIVLFLLFFQVPAIPFTTRLWDGRLQAFPSQSRASEIPEIKGKEGEIFLLTDSRYFETLINTLRAARHRIDIAMFLFKSDAPGSRPAMIIRELADAAQRGVKVRVVLEQSRRAPSLNKENRRTAEKLSENGINVVWDSPNRTSHAKIVVVDRRYCFIGSHNFTQSAMKYNHELSLLIDSNALAEKVLDYMNTFSGK